MKKIYSFLGALSTCLLLLLAATPEKAMAKEETRVISISTGNFASVNNNKCTLGGDHVSFYISGNSGVSLSGSGDLTLGKNRSFELGWEDLSEGYSLSISEIIIKAKKSLTGWWEKCTIGETTWSWLATNETKTFDLTNLNYTLCPAHINITTTGAEIYFTSVTIYYTITSPSKWIWNGETVSNGNYKIYQPYYNCFLTATSNVTSDAEAATAFTIEDNNGNNPYILTYMDGDTKKYVQEKKGGEDWGTDWQQWNFSANNGGYFIDNSKDKSDDYTRYINYNGSSIDYPRQDLVDYNRTWLFISETQFSAYEAYKKAESLISGGNLDDAHKQALIDATNNLLDAVPSDANYSALVDALSAQNDQAESYANGLREASLKAYNANYYYATFSEPTSSVTFFPADAVEVDKVTVNGNVVIISALDKQYVDVEGTSTEGYLVPANTGVLLKADVDAEKAGIKVPYYLVTESADAFTNNLLYPGPGTLISTPTDCAYYKLAYAPATNGVRDINTLGFYYGAEGGAAYTASKGLAYLAVPNGSAAPSHFTFVDAEETATAVDATESATGVVKFFENGQLFIRKNGQVYNVLGQIVK